MMEWTEIVLDAESRARVFLRRNDNGTWDSGVRDRNGMNHYCLPVEWGEDAVRHLKSLGYPEAAMRLRKRALEAGA